MRNRYAEAKTAVIGDMRNGQRWVLTAAGEWSPDRAVARLVSWNEAEEIPQALVEIGLDRG